MDGMEEKLNTILGNPEMMSQIMNMAQALGAGSQEKKEVYYHQFSKTSSATVFFFALGRI